MHTYADFALITTTVDGKMELFLRRNILHVRLKAAREFRLEDVAGAQSINIV